MTSAVSTALFYIAGTHLILGTAMLQSLLDFMAGNNFFKNS